MTDVAKTLKQIPLHNQRGAGGITSAGPAGIVLVLPFGYLICGCYAFLRPVEYGI